MTCSEVMKNVMIVPSAGCVNCQGLGKLLALNKRCFVVKLLLLHFCAIFNAILWIKLDFIGNYGERWLKMGVILGNMEYQRSNRAVMLLK